MPALLSALQAWAQIPPAEVEFFTQRLQPGWWPRGTMLVRAGDHCDRVHFIVAGLVRLFWPVGDREVNVGFDAEGRFVTAYDAFLSGTPSDVTIAAIEDTSTLWFDAATLRLLYARHACWERVGRRVAETLCMQRMAKERSIRTQSARERYASLVRDKPVLATRVPLYHLASYLGVAPETLSRIRAGQDTFPARS